MLYEFITTYREAIITKTQQKLGARPWQAAYVQELANGVPLFLTQLSETLRSGSPDMVDPQGAIATTAAHHGSDLRALGFTVAQVVHGYGDICQAITELAIEQNAPITTDEFKTLNGCLDTAIAGAVTEHTRITVASMAIDDPKGSGQPAHETRALLTSAILAYETLQSGTVAINGKTGMLLGQSLMGLRAIVENQPSDGPPAEARNPDAQSERL